MLNLKAALVSLVLGSSSVALAAPGVQFTAAAQGSLSFGSTVRDHRTTPAYTMPAPYTSWSALSAPTSLRNGSVVLRDGLSNVSQLRLQASRGMSYIQHVELRFRDGAYQTLPVNQWLTAAATIDLSVRSNRRMLDSITVIGWSNTWARSQIFAQSSRVEVPGPAYPVQPPIYQPPVNRGFSLGEDMSFFGTDGRRFLEVGADKGVFNTLRLQVASGSAYIHGAKIEFTDGGEQYMSGLQRTLLPGQSLDIALDGYSARSVARVILWTNENGAAVQTSTGTFNASLL